MTKDAKERAQPLYQQLKPRPRAEDAPEMPPLADHDIGGILTPSMSARALYRVLEGKAPFPLWLSYRMRALGLIEGKDVARIVGPKGEPFDWAITPRAAREIGLTEANDVGWALREKLLESVARFQTSTNPDHQLARQKLDRELRAAVGDFLADSLGAKHDGDQPLPDGAVVH